MTRHELTILERRVTALERRVAELGLRLQRDARRVPIAQLGGARKLTPCNTKRRERRAGMGPLVDASDLARAHCRHVLDCPRP